jgi:hypothetical protein
MLLSALAVVAGTGAALVVGGKLSNSSLASVHRIWLLLAGAGLELVGSEWAPATVGLGLVIGGYVLLIGFAAGNFRLAGMVMVALGLLANLVVVAWDGGMPVRGVGPGVTFGPRHHGERPGDHLTGLADTVRVPALGEMISAGDIVLTVGAAVVAFGLIRPRRRPPGSTRPDLVRTLPSE